jgi:hypothetical protein
VNERKYLKMDENMSSRGIAEKIVGIIIKRNVQ